MFSLRNIFIASTILLLFVIGFFIFFGYKGFSVSQSIQIENQPSPSFISQVKQVTDSIVSEKRVLLRGEETGRVNILLLGRAGEHYPGQNLTDTVMLMSIDTTNKKVALLSLPRDLYAPLPDTHLYTKINSLYQYGVGNEKGIDPLRKSVEEITGQPIDYFIILDFDGFEKAVDALGGISIDVVRDFHDERYPGKNYSYETFDIKKGWQSLDGATTLKYVRERHNDPEGDFGRAKRQQQVIQAIKDKTFSAGTFMNIFTLNSLLDALGQSVKTDMRLEDIQSFLELSKTLDTKNITTQVIDAWKKESLLRVSHIQVGSIATFILVPRIGNWNEIRDVAENIFHLDAIAERRNKIIQEQPTLSLLYKREDSALAKKASSLIHDDMGIEEISLIPLPLLENRPEQSIIVDRSGLTKPYSLDELIKKFALKKADSFSSRALLKDDSDFVLVIGSDLAEALDFEESPVSSLSTDDAFPEALPPQPLKQLR